MTYIIHRDCRHFRGDLPCKPHKQFGVICEGCSYYDPFEERVLIIKLAAVGDVIRTTPLLRKIRAERPKAHITWMTETPEVIPTRAFDENGVDEVLKWSWSSAVYVQSVKWNWLIVLDKDKECCALANRLNADLISGFYLEIDGRPAPVDDLAERKFITGIDDKLNRANKLTYPQEIFQICGYKWNSEEYLLDPCLDEKLPAGLPKRKRIVGLNTGCAPRWGTRLWPEPYWTDLSVKLKQAGFGVLLLGGPIEHEKNQRIAAASGAIYLGHFPLRQFIRIIGACDILVTAVTMAMHLAIAQKKRLVLFNNIFNPREFELYKRGELLEPIPGCVCTFNNNCELHCMDRLSPERAFDAVKRQAEALA